MNQKPRILILSCSGGYGHTAAVESIQQALGEDYELFVREPIDDTRYLGLPKGTDFYNRMVQSGWVRVLNLLIKTVVPFIVKRKYKATLEHIERYIEEVKPDFLLSVIPFVNQAAIEASQRKNIPFLAVTTDYDLTNWTVGLKNISHPNYLFTVGVEHPSTSGHLLAHGIDQSHIISTGLPLRDGFHSFSPNKESIKAIKKTYKIPSDKRVITVMMGGQGGEEAFQYAEKILDMDLSVHILVCTGKNDVLARRIERLEKIPGKSISIIRFTKKIPEILAVTDLLITKPGPGIIAEAVEMRVPMLLNQTRPPLFWEKANISLVTQWGVGEKVRSLGELEMLIKLFLEDENKRDEVKERFAAIPKNEFRARLPEICNRLLAQVVL
jgi:processive 1,2-diacylglycerol beta-glucosyltransferase